jgi:hypothetical protein
MRLASRPSPVLFQWVTPPAPPPPAGTPPGCGQDAAHGVQVSAGTGDPDRQIQRVQDRQHRRVGGQLCGDGGQVGAPLVRRGTRKHSRTRAASSSTARCLWAQTARRRIREGDGVAARRSSSSGPTCPGPPAGHQLMSASAAASEGAGARTRLVRVPFRVGLARVGCSVGVSEGGLEPPRPIRALGPQPLQGLRAAQSPVHLGLPEQEFHCPPAPACPPLSRRLSHRRVSKFLGIGGSGPVRSRTPAALWSSATRDRSAGRARQGRSWP